MLTNHKKICIEKKRQLFYYCCLCDLLHRIVLIVSAKPSPWESNNSTTIISCPYSTSVYITKQYLNSVVSSFIAAAVSKLQHVKVIKAASHLGSKRGVMSGVAPIIIEESSMLLAGVTKFFLVDLRHTHTNTHMLALCSHSAS